MLSSQVTCLVLPGLIVLHEQITTPGTIGSQQVVPDMLTCEMEQPNNPSPARVNVFPGLGSLMLPHLLEGMFVVTAARNTAWKKVYSRDVYILNYIWYNTILFQYPFILQVTNYFVRAHTITSAIWIIFLFFILMLSKGPSLSLAIARKALSEVIHQDGVLHLFFMITAPHCL